MLSAGHIAELERSFDALAAVVALRLEERKPAIPRLPGAGRTPPWAHEAPDDSIPPLSVHAGDGPLARVIADCSLNAAEALILVAAIAPEIDERAERWYRDLSDRPGVTGLTGEVARSLAGRTFADRLAVSEMLARDRPLRGLGLLRLEPAPGATLAGSLVPDPEMVAWVLGRRRPTPEESADFSVATLTTVHDLDDVVVPAHVREQLDALLARIVHRAQVVDGWGFGRHHDNARGIIALFHGPPGTGKSMSAAVVARSAGLPAYAIDLSRLVSKYIGETQKNLARLFDRAERERCVIVFDEADTLFGKRTSVEDAHDRYANQDVGYLLQRIERHPGVVILATNLLSNIDEAFQRRIDIQIEFPEPTVAERVRLWSKVLPPELPALSLDTSGLADRFELTGAQIRNAALEAAYLAAADGRVVTEAHLLHGIRSQYVKSGRTVPAATVGR